MNETHFQSAEQTEPKIYFRSREKISPKIVSNNGGQMAIKAKYKFTYKSHFHSSFIIEFLRPKYMLCSSYPTTNCIHKLEVA